MSAPQIAIPGSIQHSKDVEDNVQAQSQQDIANLAYALWQARGCPQGSAEEDWTEAERQLRTRTEQLVGAGRR